MRREEFYCNMSPLDIDLALPTHLHLFMQTLDEQTPVDQQEQSWFPINLVPPQLITLRLSNPGISKVNIHHSFALTWSQLVSLWAVRVLLCSATPRANQASNNPLQPPPITKSEATSPYVNQLRITTSTNSTLVKIDLLNEPQLYTQPSRAQSQPWLSKSILHFNEPLPTPTEPLLIRNHHGVPASQYSWLPKSTGSPHHQPSLGDDNG